MADECQPPAGEAIKNKQTDGRSRINGGSGTGRLPRTLTLIKQRPSQGKGPLEIDCIDFIAFAGKRRGGNHFPPITLFYVCPGLRGGTSPFARRLCQKQ